MKLWTWSDQQTIRPIDEHNQEQFDQMQNEVELLDLNNLLGFEFYQELKRNTSEYEDLINGGTYTYNDFEYSFNGLKYVCAFLLYSRYIRQSSIVDTFSGFVNHDIDNTRRLSSADILNLENRYKDIANNEWESCQHYLKSLEPVSQNLKNNSTNNWYV